VNPSTPRPDAEYSTAYKRFALVMLTIVYAFNFIDRQILVILQEPIKADMGLSDAQLGLLTGFSFALVYVTAGIPIAYWADRGNRRNIVSMALAVWSGMTALSGFVQNYAQLLLARVGVGIGEAGGSPPAHSMISDYFQPERRGTALSFYSMGIYIGILIGFALGGVIAQNFGWRTAFLVVGIPGVLFAVVLRITVKEPRRGRWDNLDGDAKRPTVRETLTLLRQRPSFWYIAIGCALTSYVSYGNGNFFPSFLIRSHGLSLAQVGIILALVAGIAGAIGTFLGGYLSDRLGVNDKRWYLWVPLVGLIVGIVPYFYVLLSDHTVSVLGMLVFVNIATTLYLGVRRPVLRAQHHRPGTGTLVDGCAQRLASRVPWRSKPALRHGRDRYGRVCGDADVLPGRPPPAGRPVEGTLNPRRKFLTAAPDSKFPCWSILKCTGQSGG
jgi:predicted MFS family arabinose efflux permease